MKSINKKVIERNQLTKFLSLYAPHIKDDLILDNETPDFIINEKNRKISIELTRLIKKELKAKEEFINSIIKEAEKLFLKKHEVELDVLITYKEKFTKETKINRNKYSNIIFKLIEEIYINNKNKDFDITIENKLPYFIERIYISNDVYMVNWQEVSAYLVEWDIEFLIKTILLKTNNLKKYKDDYNENWLLLISALGSKSSAFRFDYLGFKNLETKFDKIFVFNYMENKYIIIK